MIRNKLFVILFAFSVLKIFEFSVLINRSDRTLEQAKEILDKYPLIDGYLINY